MHLNWKEFDCKIKEANTILLSTHKNPDGDGLGSEIAMYYHLRNIGKDVRVINCSKTPNRYKYMDPESAIETYIDSKHDEWISELDLVIVFDLGDYSRLSKLGDQIALNNIDIINIDHHHTKDDSMYCISIIDVEAPATTYLIWKYFEYLELNNKPLNDNIALGLYSGLVNDTGSFRYSAVTSDTHNMASHLFESNIDPNMVFQNIYENKTIEQIMLLSEMIRHIMFTANNKIGYVKLDQKIFDKTGASPQDADGFADYIRGIQDVEISFCVTCYSTYSKISFRSRGLYAVNDVAEKFGGGGHYFAAGCEVNNDNLEETIKSIVDNFKEKISNVN